MKRLGLLALTVFLSGCQSSTKTVKDAAAAPPATPAPRFLTDIRQITFEGARAGEGYFSRDGRYVIFQSEREKDNPFYQMYVMDTKTGATNRISPGHGKTTCGWIHPNQKVALFASTHADPEWKKKAEAEWEERRNPKQRYNWSFDEAYDIYQAGLDGKNLKNLTNTKGYDAEGSYSPDGKWIAFASNRAGYTEKLDAGTAKHFAMDPSLMMDIYIMKSDGTGVKRLTTEPGYDGGPFFSPDGKRITYRHFTPDGKTAEVWTMNIDGSDKKQLTKLGAMSWAPFYHPSGDYLIFASNKFGFGNFELFIVDTAGVSEPVRATDMPGFDGLPVFTPDGRELVWTHSNEKGEAQLYRAQWNDALARRLLKLAPKAPAGFTPEINVADTKAWVEYLAHPYFEGRLTGGAKEPEYTAALADAFKSMGLKPGTASGYIQTYEFTSGVEMGEKNKFELQTGRDSQPLQVPADWVPLSYSKTGSTAAAPVIFAGYGIAATATPSQPAYDSYKDLDVKGKWVAVFAGLPQDVGNERRFFLHTYSRLQHKALAARHRGAAGLLIFEDSATPAAPLALTFEGRAEDVGLPVLRLSAATAERLFAAAGSSRAEWTKKLATGQIESLAIPNTTAQVEVDLRFKKSTARNVLALLPAAGAKNTVIVGAHLDHLGHGEQGNTLAPQRKEPHVGADDNASGVAGVMETAHWLAAQVKSGEVKLKQNVLFALWTGEEIGILGSSHFSNTNKSAKLTASLNMDMIGRYRDQLLVQGVGSATAWKSLVEQANAVDPLKVSTQEDPYLPSDALTFYMKQIPSIMLFTGSHPEYHTPDDTADRIHYPGLAKVAGFAGRMTVLLASPATAPVSYVKVESNPKEHPSRGLRLYLGTIPDYAREVPRGVAITGTKKDSPAEKAGLLPGDVIIELGGMPIKGMNDYVYCLQALKANEKTKMRILRAGQEKDLEITPLNKSY